MNTAFTPHTQEKAALMVDDPENSDRDGAADLVKARLAERLSTLGISERAASLMATGKPDAIRYIRVRDHVPSYDRLFAIARALQTSPEYLLGTSNDPSERSDRYQAMAEHLAEPKSTVSATPKEFDRNIGVFPVVDVSKVTYNGQSIDIWWVNLSDEIDIVNRPIFRGHREKQMYALAAPYPLIGVGDLLIIDSQRPTRIMESVLVHFPKFWKEWGAPARCSPYICGLLLRRSETDLVIMPNRTDSEIRIKSDDVILHRILTVREMLS
jgi:transcriptional regulator with XRE-family HTH domain